MMAKCVHAYARRYAFRCKGFSLAESECVCRITIIVSAGERVNSWQKGFEAGGNGGDSRSHGHSPNISPDTDRYGNAHRSRHKPHCVHCLREYACVS